MPSITLNSEEVLYLSERDWRLRHLMREIGDLDYRKAETGFHSLVHSIIEQMLSMKAGRTIEDRLLDLCEYELTTDRVAHLAPESIKACGMSMRKVQYLHSLAEYALTYDSESLANLLDAAVSAELQKLPDIGKWTCDMFLLFYLERPDILPVEDGALRQSFEWLYGSSITDTAVRGVVCSLWHPFSSIAVRYLYRALNTGLLKVFADSRLLWE